MENTMLVIGLVALGGFAIGGLFVVLAVLRVLKAKRDLEEQAAEAAAQADGEDMAGARAPRSDPH